MVQYAHPQGFRTNYLLASSGLSASIFDPVSSEAVGKYLKQCRKNREKAKILFPRCLTIAKVELENLKWSDECFERFVLKMFGGADITQLENFYGRYKRASKKNIFFLNYVRNEL